MHESYEPDAPAYGTIPRTGGSWTVKYQDKKSTTGCIISGTRTGYGDFPFDEYRGLPVIFSIDHNDNRIPFNSCYQFIEMTYNHTGSLTHPEYKTIILDINDIWLIGYYSDSKRLYTNPDGKLVI